MKPRNSYRRAGRRASSSREPKNLAVWQRAAFLCSRSGIKTLISCRQGPIVPVREQFVCFQASMRAMLPFGNMKHTPKTVGELVKSTRKGMGVTQKDLDMTSGTGLRFIIEMEKGKPTCQLGKALTVLQTLGIKIELVPPPENDKKGV